MRAAAAMLKSALEGLGIEVLLEARKHRHRRPRARPRAFASPTAASFPPISSSWPPASARAPSSPAMAGLDVKRGIVVDDRMQTSVPGIYALGECAEHRGTCYGLVEPAYEQAQCAGAASRRRRPLGLRRARCSPPISKCPASMCSPPAISSAPPAPSRSCSPIPSTASTASSSSRTGRLAGAVLLGDTADALWYLDLIRSGDPDRRHARQPRVRPGLLRRARRGAADAPQAEAA